MTMLRRVESLRPVDLERFFRPKSVCVVGASDSSKKSISTLTAKITAWAEANGAEVHYVNPRHTTVLGRPSHPTLADIDGAVDVVAILVRDPAKVVREAVAVGAGFGVVFAAGFSEVGSRGEALQHELEAAVATSDFHIMGPNTNLNAFELYRQDLPGKAIALITQSGHQGRPIFQGQEIGIRLSHWAPVGNEADLEVADFIGYFSSLSETGAIACYIEGFRQGRTAQLALDAAARRKVPVVAVKVGRTEAGSSMAKAHTGHLTGKDAVVSAVFRQYGVTRVDDLDELLEVSAAFCRTAPPSAAAMKRLRRGTPGRVCVYSISGGTGAHVADLVADAGLCLPELTPATQRALRQWIPPYLRVSNPVDNGGSPSGDWRGAKIIEAVLADPAIDLVLCPITGALASMVNVFARDLVNAAAATDKPLFVVWGSPVSNHSAYTETLLGSGVPTFRNFRNAVNAARAYFDFHRFTDRYRSAFEHPPRRRPVPADAVNVLAPTGRGRPAQTALSETEAKQLLAAYGFTLPAEVVATTASEAVRAADRIGCPVVMKVVSSDILHKSDAGLVATGVVGAAEVRRTYRALLDRSEAAHPLARVDGVLVAEQVVGTECAVGIAHDELFGPVVMFGLGGVLVEVLGDVTFRVPPFGRDAAAAMLRELRGASLLRGVRGRPAADRHALIDAVMAMQRIAVELGDSIAEVDVNPLIAGPRGAFVADALVVTA